MSEFCAGVKILLERMKSNPEDFELLDYDSSLMHSVKGRFYDFAQAVEGVVLGKTDKDRPWKDWQYFTEEERQALIAGFKEMKRAKFDKGIMERVFDEKYIDRQHEELQKARQPMYYHPSHQPPPVHPLQQGGFITTTDNTGGGLMGAIGLGGIFK
jgi:hypothetical protein